MTRRARGAAAVLALSFAVTGAGPCCGVSTSPPAACCDPARTEAPSMLAAPACCASAPNQPAPTALLVRHDASHATPFASALPPEAPRDVRPGSAPLRTPDKTRRSPLPHTTILRI